MKTLTEKQENAIKLLEQNADEQFEKDTFESCLSAIDLYASAQMKLYESANDETMNDAKPYPFFNSCSVKYKAWYATLNDKMAKANMALSNPKLARK